MRSVVVIVAAILILSSTMAMAQPAIEWDGDDLTLTHYWDCSGQSCDAGTLQPWDYNKYRSPSDYQPLDPNDFGGPSQYNEKLWVTAAITNLDLGPSDECCGDTSTGGCGKCVLIQNPDSLHPDWNVIAMKKNTCGNCPTKHADINVPGFDVLSSSLANICGDQPNTGLTKAESSILGQWYQQYNNVADAGVALCDQLPVEYQTGCYNFAQWGWVQGKTDRAKYKVIDCPEQFKAHIGSLFDENGVVLTSPNVSPVSSPVMAPTNSPVSSSPVASPTNDDNDDSNGCCSMDYKTCVTYCGTTKGDCDSCQTGESVVWLSNGPPSGQCTERWSGCDSNNVNNGCCDGLSCRWRDGYGYNACLPQPTIITSPSPTVSPTTAAPQPVNVVDEDTCVDPEDKFTFMNKKGTKVVATNKGCSWVAKKWKKRCGKLRLESDLTKKPKHVCPLACGVCIPEGLDCSPLNKKKCKQNAGCTYNKTDDTCVNRS